MERFETYGCTNEPTRLGIVPFYNSPMLENRQSSLAGIPDGGLFLIGEKAYCIIDSKPIATGNGGGEYVFTIREMKKAGDDFYAPGSEIKEVRDMLVTPLEKKPLDRTTLNALRKSTATPIQTIMRAGVCNEAA